MYLKIALLLWFLMNVAASVYIARAPAYPVSRKALQILLVWLLPVLGALALSYFLWKDRRNRPRVNEHGNLTAITDRQAISHATAVNHRGGR